MSKMNIPEMITPTQLMESLNISKGTELAWRLKGILPAPVRMGRRIYYRGHEVAKILNHNENTEKE